MLATMGCVGGLLYQSYKLVTNYISYDVNVKVSLKHARHITFPAVTVCNNNPVKKSMISHLNVTYSRKERKKAPPNEGRIEVNCIIKMLSFKFNC